MPWGLAGSFSLRPFPSEQWLTVPLSGTSLETAKGIALLPPATGYPDSWKYLGLFHVGEFVDGAAIMGPRQYIVNLSNPDFPVLNSLTEEMYPRIPGPSSGQFLVVSVYSWVQGRTLQIWEYTV